MFDDDSQALNRRWSNPTPPPPHMDFAWPVNRRGGSSASFPP